MEDLILFIASKEEKLRKSENNFLLLRPSGGRKYQRLVNNTLMAFDPTRVIKSVEFSKKNFGIRKKLLTARIVLMLEHHR